MAVLFCANRGWETWIERFARAAEEEIRVFPEVLASGPIESHWVGQAAGGGRARQAAGPKIDLDRLWAGPVDGLLRRDPDVSTPGDAGADGSDHSMTKGDVGNSALAHVMAAHRQLHTTEPSRPRRMANGQQRGSHDRRVGMLGGSARWARTPPCKLKALGFERCGLEGASPTRCGLRELRGLDKLEAFLARQDPGGGGYA